MSISIIGEGKVKHNFSRQHLIAARLFAKLADDLEVRTDTSEIQKNEHRAYVTGAVIFSVAYLEASINEFYLEAVDGIETVLVI